MKAEIIQSLTHNFESYAKQTENGVEFWLARDLQRLLGYEKWDNFKLVISKAKTACDTSGQRVSDHFADAGKTIKMPKGAKKIIDDLMLTRYACYLIYQQTGSDKNFGLIRSKGDKALFGYTTEQMKKRWKVPKNRALSDFASTLLLKAKDFATEITIFNAKTHQMDDEKQISNEHITNNQSVRETLIGRGI